MKSAIVQQFILAGILLLVFIFFSSVHFFSNSFVELRKKLGIFEFSAAFDSIRGSKENNSSILRPTIEAKRVFQEEIEIGEILPTCGLPQQCNDDSFAIHVFTGSGKEDGPKLCILGKYVLGAGLNSGGRGINAALIEPVSLRIVSVKNFDTYAGDSTQLETWIQNEILFGDIVIFFTFDEASKELSNFAKKLIFELGSYRVQELHFRSQWFMVSQRGIEGFTPYEVLHAASHSRWAEAINIRLCVPRKILGQAISPDPLSSENIPREQFCQQYNDSIYEEFCDERMEFGLALIKSKFPDKRYVLVLEDDMLLSPDFLSYMAQMLPILEKDKTLLGASAWNPNGFQGVTSDPHMAYRIEEFPGVGFLLPMSVYSTYMEGKFNCCCIGEARDGWPDIMRESHRGNLIVPDISRILTTTYNARPEEPIRSINTDISGYINRPQDLEDARYFQMIANLVRESSPLHMNLEDLNRCRLGDHLITTKIMQEYTNKKFVIYFKEDPKIPGRKLKQLIYCFGIPIDATKPRGTYKHLLRLTVNHNSVLLIEAESPFYKSLPNSVEPL